MATVVCVYKTGGDYRRDDVIRLRSSVARNLRRPYSFMCLSDDNEVADLPLNFSWPGWWSKIELFQWQFPGPVIYMDLDTVVVGEIEDLFCFVNPGRFLACRDFYFKNMINSSIMGWHGGEQFYLFDWFRQAPEYYMSACKKRTCWGDQGYIEMSAQSNQREITRWQDLLPKGSIVSYKADHVAARGVSPKTKVVCFHGKPRPRDVGWEEAIKVRSTNDGERK